MFLTILLAKIVIYENSYHTIIDAVLFTRRIY